MDNVIDGKFPKMGVDIPEQFVKAVDALSFSEAADMAYESKLPFVYVLLEKIRQLQEENIELLKYKNDVLTQPMTKPIWDGSPEHSWPITMPNQHPWPDPLPFGTVGSGDYPKGTYEY